MTDFRHKPALLQQVIEMLNVQKDAQYIDATLGGGGHTDAIIHKGGIVLGIDQDQEALEFVKKNQEVRIKNHELVLAYGNFKDIKQIAADNGFEKVSGILFDLGVSSYQLDTKDRGFSIKQDSDLDMRMDANSQLTAKEIVNTYGKDALIEIFVRFGEEDKAEIIAEEIVKRRKRRKIETTGELVKIIEAVKKRTGRAHPATSVFQALRIEVNQEMDVLKAGINNSLDLLDSKGRILVISFHSLEDRIIKLTFDNWERQNFGSTINTKPITADNEEIRSNPRARSAKLRVFERI